MALTFPDSGTHATGPRVIGYTIPRVIGYDRDGEMIWASAGGRSNHGIGGIAWAVDDRDGDEPDDTDDVDEDDDDDDGEYEIDDRDDDDDDEDGDDEGEVDDEQDDPRARRKRRERAQENRWEPPSETEWTTVQEALKRNNAELQRNREARKVMKRLGVRDAAEFANFLIERGVDPDTGDALDGQGGGEGGEEQPPGTPDRQAAIQQHRRAEQRGAERESARWRPAVVQFAAAEAFRDAGFSGGSLNRVLQMLDTDGVDVEFDEHGEVIVYGLDEQVATIKGDLPELFRPKRTRAEAPGADDGTEGRERPRRREGGRRIGGTANAGGARAIGGGDRAKPPPHKLTWLEKTDRAMRGLSAEPRGRRG